MHSEKNKLHFFSLYIIFYNISFYPGIHENIISKERPIMTVKKTGDIVEDKIKTVLCTEKRENFLSRSVIDLIDWNKKQIMIILIRIHISIIVYGVSLNLNFRWSISEPLYYHKFKFSMPRYMLIEILSNFERLVRRYKLLKSKLSALKRNLRY